MPVSYQDASVAVLPLPYEGSVSYGIGASRGPAAILEASSQLEMYDEELDRRIDSVGITTLPPVRTEGLDPDAVMREIHERARQPLADGKWLVGLGGEHSVSYGLFTAQLEKRGKPFSILQIDAHADLRDSYQGNRHSHACIMARALELGLPFVQVGIRSLSQPERALLRQKGLEDNVFWAHQIAPSPERDDWMNRVVDRLGEEVYLTIDLDGLDPSIMPATGTPEPGGLGWYPLLKLLRKVAEERRVIGMDVVELAPIEGFHAPDFLTARLVFKMIGYHFTTGQGGTPDRA